MKKIICCNIFLLGILVMFITSCENTSSSKNNSLEISIDSVRTIYKIDYINDHSIIYNENDKKWHFYGIVSPHTKFLHLTAGSLTQEQWNKEDDFFVDNNREIWAPHIIKNGELFYMFYTRIGEPREICCATSKDLYHWDYMDKPLIAFSNEYSKNLKNKDPMVFYDEVKKQWIMYFSMMKDADKWVVGYSTSKNLTEWSDYKICFDENSSSPGVESPFVIKYKDKYLLFLSARPWPAGGEDVFVSDSPYYWESGNLIKRFFPWHAAEVVTDINGDLYMTLSSGMQSNDLRITKLNIK